MSDSEAEFESADEGSNDGNGWDVESDFDLPSVESAKPSKTEIDSFSNAMDTEQNVKCKEENVKPSEQNKADDVLALESKLEKLSVNNETTNSGCVPEGNKVVQNESKSNSTQSSSWGGWSSGWSVNSLISTASAITNQVSQGITNVIGAPTPEQLASVDKENIETSGDKLPESVLGTNYFLNNVSQITKIVETTGSKIINGGLDTLETVGKKTLEVLQEGDPGLRKKRALFFQNTEKINLSQVLQEAKEKAEVECKQNNQVESKKGYAFLLDSYQGLVHLESLELLSKQSQMKLQTVLLSCSGTQLTNIQDTLQNLKELCYFECDDDDKQFDNKEFKTSLVSCINQISVDVKTEKILRVSDSINEKLKEAFDCEDNIHDEGISALAELTAAAMELYYKLGEMLMIDNNIDNHLATVKAENLTLLNEAVCCRIRSIANEYACLLTKFDADNTSNLISDIYLESSNSSSYIQDAAQLLIPILQLSII